MDGRTALIWASGAGHLDIVHLLLEAGADKDVADNDGRTALHRASNTGQNRSLAADDTARTVYRDHHGLVLLVLQIKA